jgi:multidrug efflux pump subunit AcrA (membrane-fusion protein)
MDCGQANPQNSDTHSANLRRCGEGIAMKHQSSACDNACHKTRTPVPARVSVALTVALLAPTLSACSDGSAMSAKAPAFVRVEIVRPQDHQVSITLTGEVRARLRADLAFRVSGRVLERLVDVGAHVNAGDVLARLDPATQQADVDAATAAVVSAEAQLRVAKATFDRQNQLLASGFTTRVLFDQAQQTLRTAEGSLEAAKAQLGTAKDALGYTELRADAAGVISARSLEVGQVLEAAQAAFTLAHDGDRDALWARFSRCYFCRRSM